MLPYIIWITKRGNKGIKHRSTFWGLQTGTKWITNRGISTRDTREITITNRGKRDYKSGQGLQTDAEQLALLQISLSNYFSRETKLLWEGKSCLQKRKKNETVNEFISARIHKMLSNDTDETLRSKRFSNGFGILSKETTVRKKTSNFPDKYMFKANNKFT